MWACILFGPIAVNHHQGDQYAEDENFYKVEDVQCLLAKKREKIITHGFISDA